MTHQERKTAYNDAADTGRVMGNKAYSDYIDGLVSYTELKAIEAASNQYVMHRQDHIDGIYEASL